MRHWNCGSYNSPVDVAIASCMELPEPDHDEELLLEAMRESGITAGVLSWDDPNVDWSGARITVLRSTWNYQLDRVAFLRWAESVAKVAELWNPFPIISWNSHKSYLLDLDRRGLPVVPTELVTRNADRTLESILADRGWQSMVIKPAVSASSYRTLRIDAGQVAVGEVHLRALAAEGDGLVQSYLPSVEGYGERALVWIDGEVTHAVRKSPRFSGEDESVSEEVEFTGDERLVAERAIEVVGDLLSEPLLYARIDLAPDADGNPVVMELELIEPSLFFKQSTEALRRFVAAIQRRIDQDESAASPMPG